MKGKILDFSIQSNTGIILADDHKRYHFVGSEWKEQQAPVRGHEVDFEINNDNQAITIYLKITSAPTLKTKVSTPSPISNYNTAQQSTLKERFNTSDDHTDATYHQAIVTCFKKFADFKSRARRSEFWYFELFCVLISILLSLFSEELATIAMLITLIPNIAVSVRRLHDIDRSGWWMLIVFVPIIGIGLLLFWAAQEGNSQFNQYGPSPKA